MKAKLLIGGILILYPMFMSAQQSDILETNSIRARVWNDGDLFWDKDGHAGFEFPAWSGKHSNNLSGLWIIGVNANGDTVGATTFHRNDAFNETDFYPGPLDINCTQTVDSNTMVLYNRVWKINRTEIAKFILCHCVSPNDSFCAGYVVPDVIKEWPGNPIAEADGDHINMDEQLAPFYDGNGDGVYEWQNCDFPLIRGDQGIFWVMNDQGGNHDVSGLPPMNVEVRAMAYSTSCDNYLDSTIFIDYEIIPRCGNVTNLYVGMYSEADAGNGGDDFAGTTVNKNLIYHYNGDQNDAVYGTNLPVTGTALVRGPRMKINGIDDIYGLPEILALTDTSLASGAYGVNGQFFGDSIPDDERLGFTRTMVFNNDSTVTGNPATGDDFYQYLRGYWKDGSRMVYGGNGYPAGVFASAPEANYMYPGASDPDDVGTKGVVTAFGWTETNTGSTAHVPGDRKTLGITGPIDLAANGNRIKLTYAFFASSATPADTTGISTLSPMVSSLMENSIYGDYFLDDQYNQVYGLPNVLCLGNTNTAGNEEFADAEWTLFPNPVTDQFTIQTDMTDATISLIDIAGRVINVSVNMQGGTFTVHMGELSTGMYIVQLQAGKVLLRKKIIKL